VLFAEGVGTAYDDCMQYTLRRVPRRVDEAIRQRARVTGKSLNEVALAALADGAGVSDEPRSRRDLTDIAGTWKREAAVERALAAQDKVNPTDWR
jgi:hypothetical protein